MADETFTGTNDDGFVAPTLAQLHAIIAKFPKTRKPLRIFTTPDCCMALKDACLPCAKDAPFMTIGDYFAGIPVETYNDRYQMILAALQSKARGERPIYFGPKEFLQNDPRRTGTA